ncbi:MAG: chemotaxis protein CheB [Chloroflexota bacterium]
MTDQKKVETEREIKDQKPKQPKQDGVTPQFIVGIGASAGGLEALEKFFKNVPPDTGMGFVIIQHLLPTHKSLMAELLGKMTKMMVEEAEEGVVVKPNCVYLIPSGKTMTIKKGALLLEEREPKPTLSMPIDIFFESLALDQKEQAVGVVLSGNGSDGTNGIREIKKYNGRIYSQDTQTAQFTGMPHNAINTQILDYVASPELLPKAIIHNLKIEVQTKPQEPTLDVPPFQRILKLIATQTGVDFSYYKQNTLLRRIERRMQILQFSSLEEYSAILSQSHDEIDLLFQDMLIGVTSFFRDPETFEALKRLALTPLVLNKKPHDVIRVWVPGCSSGEEAYTLAMLFREVMSETGRKVNVKIFATDIDQNAIDFASRGFYAANSFNSMSEERREAFFNTHGKSYEVKRYLREMIVFAKQNLLTDPPFSRIDLISCRNLLIYFELPYQKKAGNIFRFGLNQNGYLLLGSSEVLDSEKDFKTIDAKHRIFEYQRKNHRFSQPTTQPILKSNDYQAVRPQYSGESIPKRIRTQIEMDNMLYKDLLESFHTASILIDNNRFIKYAFGNLKPFLNVPSGGRIEFDLVNMAIDELSIPLSTAIHKAFKLERRIEYHHVPFIVDDDKKMILDISASPVYIKSTGESFALIVFQTKELDTDFSVDYDESGPEGWTQSAIERIQQLEKELDFSQENLQATIEELETANEELQATNEELLASNEELQSTNEELQSVNEELLTVNAEYQVKIHELTEVNNDVSNLFNTTQVGTIFLDENLNIRKFTPAARREINLIDQDIGRPLSHISHNLIGIDLADEAMTVLNTLIVREKEVQNEQGIWFMIKMIPYRTVENVIKGIVITLVDITLLKKTQVELEALAESTRKNELRFHQALQFSRIAIFHQDQELRYSWVYNPFPKFPGYEDRSTIGKTDYDLFLEKDAKKLTEKKQTVLVTGLGTREVVELTIQNERVIYDLFVEPLENDKGQVVGVACVSIDITDRK